MGLDVSYDVDDGVLVVRQRGVCEDIEACELFRADVEARLAALPRALVLFDNTRTNPPAEEVRNHLHDWLMSSLPCEAAALLFESDLMAVSINMAAMGRKRKVKAFGDEAAALTWLRTR